MPFTKGKSGNPGGLTKAQREARDKLRAALAEDAEEVHKALMRLVKADVPAAVVYAHQVIHGKEPEKLDVEHSGSVEFDYAKLPTEKLRELKALLEQARVAPDDGSATTH